MDTKTMMLQRQILSASRFAKHPARLFWRLGNFISVVGCLVAVTRVEAMNPAFHVREIDLADIGSMKSPQLGFQTVARGYRSGVRTPLQVAARTELEWDMLWRQHASIEATSPPLPVIDFNEQIIVGLFLGDKPSGGYQVDIIRAELINNELIILYRERAPTGRGVVVQALTQPFHIVRVTGAINSKVIFRRES